MFTEKKKFLDFLRLKGLKFTPQRQIIIEEIFAFHRHFDVEELFEKLRKSKKFISRATIYRLLPLLIENGLIKEAIRCENKITYEHIYGHKHHDHMICIKCGKVIEFRNEKIEELQSAICKKYGFMPVDHRLGIKGYCSRCYKSFENTEKQ